MAKSTNVPKGADLDAKKVKKPLSEFVIKEIMIQQSVSREEAIRILENPTPQVKR